MKKILQLSFFILILNCTQSHAQLVANFSADITQGCTPLDSVQFTDLSTGNPTTWNWNFGNGNTSTLKNPQASYPNPGVFTVTLTVGNGTTTNTVVKTGYITVFALPEAHFNYTPVQPCLNSIVTFTDHSILGNGPIVSWHWGFGDGTTATVGTSPTTHSYSSAITAAPVSVIVTDSHGCEGDFDTLITVNAGPVVAFTASPTITCNIPGTVNFTDNSITSGTVTRLWTFGDGGTSTLQNPTHIYAANGNYAVKLLVTQGTCKDSLIKYNYIYVVAYNASFTASDTSVCVGDSILFTETSPLLSSTRTWNFGDGTTSYLASPSHVYGAPGFYTVKLIGRDAYGCMDTVIKTNYIHVNVQPVASFTANDTIACSPPLSVIFSSPNTGGITSWSWNFGDGGVSSLQNPAHNFTTTGIFTVTLIVTNANGCKATLIKPGYIKVTPPVVAFKISPKKGCSPLTVNFTSNSTAIEPIANYTWNYGDGTSNVITTVGNTTHTYTIPGAYTVSLIVNTINGCRDTLIKVDSVLVGFHVTPSFTISDDTVCYHDPITFTFNTPGANSWTWIFGDGGMDSLQQNPIHIYGDTGTFTVSLVACNNGCCDTLVIPHMVTILPPKAQFSVASSCITPYKVTCTNSSAGADSIVWNFHDGSAFVSNTSPVNHTYATRGIKSITIYAFNFATGCEDSMLISYQVTDPIARFKITPLAGCYPLIVTITDTSQDASSHYWEFGDANTYTTALISFGYTYFTPGLFTVKEVITDMHGCKDSITKPNYVHTYGPLPGFTANKDSGCAPLSVIFSDTSHSEFPIVSRIWNFGDGVIDTIATTIISHIYLNPGTYTVTLTVKDSQGCIKTITIPNYIRASLPIASFVVDTFSCPGKVVNFNAAASVATGGSYHWAFGDGNTFVTTLNTATHTYTANGNYTATLTLIDQNGCDSSVSHPILIENPVANFSDSAFLTCGNAQVTFYNLSTGTALTAAYWNFGNGGTSVSMGTTFNNYVNPGYYNVSLIITNAAGCKDTLIKDSIIVVPGPIGSFDFAPKSGCSPLYVTFTASSPNSIKYSWDFGDGNVLDTTAKVVIHKYSQDIVAFPSLTISAYQQGTTNLCLANAPTSNPNDSVIVQTFSDANISVNGDNTITVVQLNEGAQQTLTAITNITGTNTNITWSPAGILSCDTCQTTLLNGNGYEGYIYLKVKNAGGCAGEDSIFVKYIPCDNNPVIQNIFTPNGDGVNDEFFVDKPCPGNFSLTIYNRWGQEVFKTTDPFAKWDGKSTSGEFVPSGTYYWILGVKNKSLKGFLQLIREKKN